MSYLRLGFLKAFVSSGRILDIGYGTGTFLRIAAQVGFDCYGVEVHGVARGVREVALNAEVEDWDVVTFFDSLEHFRNFDDLRGIFARSRFVMVSVPLTPPAFPERREWRHYKPGEHLHYFCAKSLRKLIGKSHVIWSNLEDAIRSPIPGRQNILTGLFTNERLAATSL